jgi:hypothetical protein
MAAALLEEVAVMKVAVPAESSDRSKRRAAFDPAVARRL